MKGVVYNKTPPMYIGGVLFYRLSGISSEGTSKRLRSRTMTIKAQKLVSSARIWLKWQFGDSLTALAADPIAWIHLPRSRTLTIKFHFVS